LDRRRLRGRGRPGIDPVAGRPNGPEAGRERAAYALGRIGPAARGAVSALRAATADRSDWDAYVAAKLALERVVPPPTGGGSAPALTTTTVKPVYPSR